MDDNIKRFFEELMDKSLNSLFDADSVNNIAITTADGETYIITKDDISREKMVRR